MHKNQLQIEKNLITKLEQAFNGQFLGWSKVTRVIQSGIILSSDVQKNGNQLLKALGKQPLSEDQVKSGRNIYRPS